MKLEPATDNEIEHIIEKLERGKSRPKSGDYLAGFPWGRVKWYKAILEVAEFERLFLFWTGSAWDESTRVSPRRLKDGVAAFKQLNSQQSKNCNLKEVKCWLTKCETGEFRIDEPFFILVGQDQDGPLMILDGNHRAAGVLWWMAKNGGKSKTLKCWLGLSTAMSKYPSYWRVLQAHQSISGRDRARVGKELE